MHSYNFLTDNDRANYEALMAGQVKNKIIVIQSAKRGAGKTSLAHEIMNAYGEKPLTRMLPNNSTETENLFNMAVVNKTKAVLFDNIKRIPENAEPEIERIMFGEFSVRELGSTDHKIHNTEMIVVVTANGELQMSEDLRRRALFITITGNNGVLAQS